jgi:hypothetical protein
VLKFEDVYRRQVSVHIFITKCMLKGVFHCSTRTPPSIYFELAVMQKFISNRDTRGGTSMCSNRYLGANDIKMLRVGHSLICIAEIFLCVN